MLSVRVLGSLEEQDLSVVLQPYLELRISFTLSVQTEVNNGGLAAKVLGTLKPKAQTREGKDTSFSRSSFPVSS